MRTKILYILVSGNNDVFWEQTYISISSIRKVNRQVHISILMDRVTFESLIGIRAKLKDMIDESIVIDLPIEYTNKEKSRILKTNMRNYVKGDFLFIDSDTIILSDISDIDNINYDIAAVYERNRSVSYDYNRASYEEAIFRFGCKMSAEDEYFNSGVMYVKDNNKTHQFFSDWHAKWLTGKNMGIYFDQPSLGVVNQAYNNFIKPLDGEWNCQGRYCLRFMYRAKIFHYLFDSSFSFPLMSKDAFADLKATGNLSEILKNLIDNPFYYISPNNEILTGNDVKRFHSRMYSFIRLLDNKYPNIYNVIELILNSVYSLVLKCKKRNLTPPR